MNTFMYMYMTHYLNALINHVDGNILQGICKSHNFILCLDCMLPIIVALLYCVVTSVAIRRVELQNYAQRWEHFITMFVQKIMVYNMI